MSEDPGKRILDMDRGLERALRLAAISEQGGRASLEQAGREALDAMTAVADQLARLDEPQVRLRAAIGWLHSALEREARSDPGRKSAAD